LLLAQPHACKRKVAAWKKRVPSYSMENKIHSTESGSAPTIPITFAPRKKPTPLASGCPNAQPAQVPSKTPFAPPYHPDTPPPENPPLSPKIPAAHYRKYW
jgi:hypothetical protein